MTCPIGYQQRGNVCVANLDNSNTLTPTPTECGPGEIGFHSVHVDQRGGMDQERTENVTPHCRRNDGRSLPEVVRGRTDLCRPNYAVSIWQGGGDDEIRCLDRNFSARRLAMPHVPSNPISPRPYGVSYDVSSEAPPSESSETSSIWSLEAGERTLLTGIDLSQSGRPLNMELASSVQVRVGGSYRLFDPNGINYSFGLHASYYGMSGYQPPSATTLWTEGRAVGVTASASIGYPIFAKPVAGLIALAGVQASAYGLITQNDHLGASTHDGGLAEVNPFVGLDFIFNDVHFGPFSKIVGRMTCGYMWGERLGESGLSYRGPTLMDMSIGVGW